MDIQKEIKPWPLAGYAPGNYMNTCAYCKKQMEKVDKLCFMCLECALIETHKYISHLEKERGVEKAAEEAYNKIQIVIECFERFMPKDVAMDDIKQMAMYEAFHRLKEIQTLAIAGVKDAGNDAVEFAEWAALNFSKRTAPGMDGYWWGDKRGNSYTTEQLYNLFKHKK